jgi:hypothetical protein
MQHADLGAERYTASASCILPMFSQIDLDQYTSFYRVTGYQRITACDMLSTARLKKTYVEINIEPFGLNIYSDCADMQKAELDHLAEPVQNSVLSSNMELAKASAPENKTIFEIVARTLSRANRSENKDFAFYCVGANTIIAHIKTYNSKTGQNAIGMECIRKLYSVDGVKSVQVVNSHPPYIEVTSRVYFFRCITQYSNVA